MTETTSTIDSVPRAAGAGPLMRGVNLHKWYKVSTAERICTGAAA